MESIITASISAAATLIVCMINNRYQRKRDERAHEAKNEQQKANLTASLEEIIANQEKARETEKEKQQEDLTAHLEEIIANQDDATSRISNEIKMLKYQMSEFAKHVEKHNNVIERTYELEKRTEIQEEKIKVANHRLEDLEKAVG